MRYDSLPSAMVVTALYFSSGLCACQTNEYDTETLSDVSQIEGGTEAEMSSARPAGGRSGSSTTRTSGEHPRGVGSGGAPFANGGSGMGSAGVMTSTPTNAGTSSTASRASGGATPSGGATAGGAKSSRGTAATTSVQMMGGTSTTSSANTSAGTSTRITFVGGANSTTRTNPTGGTNGSGGTSSPGSTASGGSSSTSATTAPISSMGTEFSPYFYTWGWGNSAYAFSGLQDLKTKTQLKSVTLAFVLSSGQCGATTDIQDHLDDVNAYRNSGGHVKASFGGANGTYLESACTDAQSLAKVLSDFVTATDITDLDFDVEQSPSMDATVNERRARALKQVQTEKGIAVSLTLAATPRDKWGTLGGLSAASLSVVRAMLDAKVKLTRVNIMAMDYGAYFSSGNSMGALAISALTDTLTQIKALMPGISDAEGWQLLGATPMIGQNDVASEVFSLEDARTLITFAKEKNLGLVSFWAINRDQPCPYSSLAVCSQVNVRNFEFSEIFAEAE